MLSPCSTACEGVFIIVTTSPTTVSSAKRDVPDDGAQASLNLAYLLLECLDFRVKMAKTIHIEFVVKKKKLRFTNLETTS